MCTYTESAMNRCDNTDPSEPASTDASWLEKCLENENALVDYLKSIMVASFNVDAPAETILAEYDGTESGFEALDNLYELLASLCDSNLSRRETSDRISMQDKSKKQESRNKRTLKCLSPTHGKELQVKSNRARSHSSVGVDEIMRTQELMDGNSSESRRKSRRVSLGMRPRFSNWSRVKGAFKRDKSNSRVDSREADYPDACYSGDESTEKSGQFSSSHENINQLSSSDEEFEYYPTGYPNETGFPYQADNEQVRRNSPSNAISKSKSAIIKISNSNPHASTSTHKNPFKWYRSKNATYPSENGPHEAVSTPPSPYKTYRFLYDEDSINRLNDEQSGNSGNDALTGASSEVLQEVQNKYESLQKRLSREFYEKYQDWRKSQGHETSTNDGDEEKYPGNVDESKLSPFLADQSLSPRFKQKFQEWQKIKGLSLSPTRTKIKTENFNPLKKSKSDWHKWRPGSKSESNVIRFLMEKEVGESPREVDTVNFYGDPDDRNSGSSIPGYKRASTKSNQPVVEKKELAWLEKELQKVAREKQRLEKEKEKYAERETRLRNMKRAIKSGRKRKQEVLVPTSTGLFRFQGISSKFTRKLYEWEKAKGITPESSTFALLDSYYGGGDAQLQNTDATLLSRSRSVGSVEVAGIGTSMLQSTSANQQSSLSLNDMEQLEEAHLNVENDSMTQNGSQQFDKDDDNEFDLISNESLAIPEFSKCSTSQSIPPSSSTKSLHDQDSNDLCSSKQSNESEDFCGSYGSGPRIMFHPIRIQTDPDYELVLHKKEQRDSANADARNIVDQIKRLRARTSIDDEDRINILTNLEHLADQLVDMVHTLNNHKNENSDELAVQIAELAVTLKKKIKRLTHDELQNASNEKLPSSRQNSGENFQLENAFTFDPPEDTYTDTEDNDSPTVHCTFTLPSWRVNKYTTPSSTESESYTTKNKYVDTRQTKTDRQRGKYFKDDNSSGGDENYDGSDETTMYIDLRSMKNKNKRRESSDNVSTSASESLIHSDPRDFTGTKYSPSPEPACGNDDQNVLYCSLTLDAQKGSEVKERKLNSRNADTEVEQYLVERDQEDPPIKLDLRSFSPKPTSSKRKCSSCGKIKRISKSRKSTSNNYCTCGKKETDKTQTEKSFVQKSPVSSLNTLAETTFPKSAAYPSRDDLTSSSEGSKIFRSKVYDFNSLKSDADKDNVESETSKVDKTSSINVIVPTTRKIFTPLRRNEDGGASAVVSYTVDESDAGNKVERGRKSHTDSMNSNFISPPWVSDLRSKSASPAVDRKSASGDTKSPPSQRPRDKKKLPMLELHANVDKLPPASPLSAKRVSNKDSPGNNSSIRMMIAHYNKLTSENPNKKPLDSSCWTSAKQKSPVLERRARFENITSETNNIRKSKSAVLAVKNDESATGQENSGEEKSCLGIAKSSSAGALRYSPPNAVLRVNKPTEIKRSPPVNAKKGDKKPVIKQKTSTGGEVRCTKKVSAKPKQHADGDISKSIKNSATIASFPSSALERTGNTSFEDVLADTKLRTIKLQEAKNKFFNDYPAKNNAEEGSESNKTLNVSDFRDSQENVDDAEDNRSTTTEPEVESVNFGGLNKSISTGAIDDRSRGCTHPGTCEKSPSKSKFGFSSIASKFRKVKMRRHKEPEISAVSSLCRASLMMNIEKEGKQREYLNSSKSCPSSPVMNRSMSKRNSSSN